MLHRGFFTLCPKLFGVALGLLLVLNPAGAEAASDDAVRATVVDYVWQFYADSLGPTAREDVDIRPGNLDPRLNLAECDTPLVSEMSSPEPLAANLTVKVQCTGSKPWTIYVPVKVDRFARVVVAGRNLARGTVLSEADITVARMNIAQAGTGYLEDPVEVLGKELQRSLRLGNSVQHASLREPTVIRRGDSVEVTAISGGIAVAARAEALSHGRLGERIKVKNARSKRVVEATVTGPGAVAISLSGL